MASNDVHVATEMFPDALPSDGLKAELLASCHDLRKQNMAREKVEGYVAKLRARVQDSSQEKEVRALLEDLKAQTSADVAAEEQILKALDDLQELHAANDQLEAALEKLPAAEAAKDAASADPDEVILDTDGRGPAVDNMMFNQIIGSIDAVFAHFSQTSGVPAERLGHAMRVLGMNPTQDAVEKYLEDLGGPKSIDQERFHHFMQEKLGKCFRQAQVMVDYLDHLKQYDKDGKGALSPEELQEAIEGSELSQELQVSLGKVPRNSQGHLDIVELSKCFLEIGNHLEFSTGAEGTTRQEVASKARVAIVQADVEARYSLKEPEAFARFLKDADVRLVRAKYLAELVRLKQPLPRRQEAESLHFLCDGEKISALVTHDEVQSWALGTQKAIICSISHAWETMEHPDPCRYQLQHIVNHTGLYDAAFDADIWVFYDFVSVFQHPKAEGSHERISFDKAMRNMHLMYAHECTLTFRIETLTPDDLWEAMKLNLEDLVPVWDDSSRTLKPKPLTELKPNKNEYRVRGWCMAEVEWSSLRRVNAQHQRIDRLKSDKEKSDGVEDGLNGRVPKTPEDFRDAMFSAKFTWRSDEENVIKLQNKIFHEKVTECEHLELEGLPISEILALSHVLPYYRCLQSMKLKTFRCGEAEATAFGKALASSQVEKLEVHNNDSESSKFLVKAIAEALKTNMSIRHINLEGNDIRAEGAQALAEALKINESVTEIKLGYNRILDEGAKALAEALRTNHFVRDINLQRNCIGADGAKDFAESLKSLKENIGVRVINMARNPIGADGAKALAEALKINVSVTEIKLGYSHILNEGAKALAEALRTNESIRDINLQRNCIRTDGNKETLKTNHPGTTIGLPAGAKGRMGNQQIPGREPFEAPVRLKALAEALKTNSIARDIDLTGDSIGAKGAEAIAQALKTNTSVTDLNMKLNRIGPEGAKALAHALEMNMFVGVINMEHNDIGTEGAKALAEALMTNLCVSSINLANNGIGVEGAKALAEALMTNLSVNSINLANNGIGVEGAKALAEALMTDTSVNSINLANNAIGFEGAKALAEALITDTSVSNINLANNGIGVEGEKAFKELLEEKKRMGFEVSIVFREEDGNTMSEMVV